MTANNQFQDSAIIKIFQCSNLPTPMASMASMASFRPRTSSDAQYQTLVQPQHLISPNGNNNKNRNKKNKSPKVFRNRQRSNSLTDQQIINQQFQHRIQNLQSSPRQSQQNQQQQQQQQQQQNRKRVKFVNNQNVINHNSQQHQPQGNFVPRVFSNSVYNGNRIRRNSESTTSIQNFNNSTTQILKPITNVGNVRNNRYSPNKPGMSMDYVSNEIMDYYQRNRQSNEKYKAKQILRQSLENTLRQSFPTYFIHLHTIGSSINGIGDNVSCVDFCITSHKKRPVQIDKTSRKNSISALENEKNQEKTSTDEEKSEEKSFEGNSSGEEKSPEKEASTSADANTTLINTDQSKDSPNQKCAKTIEEEEKCETSTTVSTEEKITIAPADSTGNGSNIVHDQLTLENIEKILKTKNFAQNIQLVPARMCPIIKFKDVICHLNVKLILNEEVSIRNSQLVRDYSKMDWRFPLLATIVKQWARENHINNAAEKTISSYSWTLMVIHYLQTLDPPVLPCLQKMFPQRYYINISMEEEMIAWRQAPVQWRSANNISLRNLLKGFFRYYGYVFDYDQYIISVREGKIMNRIYRHLNRPSASSSNGNSTANVSSCDENSGIAKQEPFMYVEEPFTGNNTTRSVHDEDIFDHIKELLRMSSNALKGSRISLYNIIIDDRDFPNSVSESN